MLLFSNNFLRVNTGFSSSYKNRFWRCYSFTQHENKIEYKQQNYMRSVLEKTKGCVLYKPSKLLESIISPKVSNERNKIVSNLEAAVKKMQLYKRFNDMSYNKKVFSPLNDQCLDDFKNWPINEQLYALDVWHFVKNVNQFSCFNKMLTEFIRQLNELSNSHALQTMYYVVQTKQLLNPTEENIVMNKIDKLEKNEATFNQISIYCLALFLNDVNNRSHEKNDIYHENKLNLVNSLYSLLMKIDLRNTEDVGFSNIIKAVRRFSTIFHLHQMRLLQNKLVPFVQNASLPSLTHIIQLGSKQRVFNEQLIDLIITRFTSNLNKLRTKEVERALLVISTFNRNDRNDIERRFCDEVQKNLLKSLDTIFQSTLIQCITYLTILDVVDKRLIEWALNPTTNSNINGNEHNLLVIDAYAKINLSGIYIGTTFSEKLCAKIMPNVNKNRAPGEQSDMAQKIMQTFENGGVHCTLIKEFPYVPYPDNFLVYNKQTQKSMEIIEINTNGKIIKPNDLYSQEDNTHLVAIAVLSCLQRQTVMYTNRYNGIYQQKLNQLIKLGFKPIVIKQTIWKLYKTPRAKQRYLNLMLCKNDVYLLQNMDNFVPKSKNYKYKNKTH